MHAKWNTIRWQQITWLGTGKCYLNHTTGFYNLPQIWAQPRSATRSVLPPVTANDGGLVETWGYASPEIGRHKNWTTIISGFPAPHFTWKKVKVPKQQALLIITMWGSLEYLNFHWTRQWNLSQAQLLGVTNCHGWYVISRWQTTVLYPEWQRLKLFGFYTFKVAIKMQRTFCQNQVQCWWPCIWPWNMKSTTNEYSQTDLVSHAILQGSWKITLLFNLTLGGKWKHMASSRISH